MTLNSSKTNRLATVVALSAAFGACTMKSQEAPPLTGPSGYAVSIDVQATPDVLQLDGASQSVIVVTLRDVANQPIRNAPLRADIQVDGQIVDFGSLSSKSLVTNNDGRAMAIYTAPGGSGDAETLIDVVVRPVGTNYENTTRSNAAIRLVPTGIRLPPSDLKPAFTFSPETPSERQNVLFDASSSSGTIASYEWDFGDGQTGSGRTTTHAFPGPGTYFVRLTLVDPQGRRTSTTRSIAVGQGTAPTAAFVFSPSTPHPGDLVHFNATASAAAPGRRIVNYAWDFGNGQSGSGSQVSQTYLFPRTYTVTLTVTDDIGRTATISRTVAVEIPDDDGGSPQH